MKTLDRSRSFGEVLGGGPACFLQDEIAFDREGREIVSRPNSSPAPSPSDTSSDGGSAPTSDDDAPERPAALVPGPSSLGNESGGRRRQKQPTTSPGEGR